MTSTHTHIAAQQLHIAVLQTLRYFEFFDHALYGEEIYKYLTIKSTQDQLSAVLNHLRKTGEIVSKDGLYALNKDHIELRLRHIERNQKMMKAAKRVGAFIHLFPYVRGVYLSGSLSKHGITGQDDDLDFFIITKAGRVWAAKLLLIAFKKIVLLNSEKYFCINLLMSEEELVLNKKNIYIATEAASLVALTNEPLLQAFFAANPWVQHQFPNLEVQPQKERSKGFNPLEATLEFIGGRALERNAHRLFKKHVEQQRKASGYYDISEGVSAYFPHSVEEQLLAHLAQKSDNHE